MRMALWNLSVLVLEGIALSDQVLQVKLQVFGAAFKLSIDFEDVNLVKLLRSKFDVLVVKLVEIFLQFGELVCQLCLGLNIGLHLLVFHDHALFLNSLVRLQLLDLTLLIFIDLLCLSQFLWQTLYSLFHLANQVLQLLDLLERQLLFRNFLPHIVFLLVHLILQALYLLSQLQIFSMLAVKFPLHDPLSIILECFLLISSLSLKLLLA